MPTETEKKYLVRNRGWAERPHSSKKISQGYICLDPDRTVRVRIAGEKGFITVKGGTTGLSREEFEYEIPPGDAIAMIETMCGRRVDKIRHTVDDDDGYRWTIDEFKGENEGLVIAEIELSERNRDFPEELPEWIGEEVSGKTKYFNSQLSEHPFSDWKQKG